MPLPPRKDTHGAVFGCFLARLDWTEMGFIHGTQHPTQVCPRGADGPQLLKPELESKAANQPRPRGSERASGRATVTRHLDCGMEWRGRSGTAGGGGGGGGGDERMRTNLGSCQPSRARETSRGERRRSAAETTSDFGGLFGIVLVRLSVRGSRQVKG